MQSSSLRKFEIDPELFASQNQRFVNYLVDYISQLILAIILAFIISIIASFYGNNLMLSKLTALSFIQRYTLGAFVLLIYYNIFEIFFSITLGKVITNTVVVNQYGEKPETNEILIRSLCRIIPLEHFSFLGAPNKGWHDRISKTFVVKKELLEQKKKAFYSGK